MLNRKLGYRAAALLVGCLLSLFVAEMMLRAFLPSGDRCYLWPPNLSATMTPATGVMYGVGPVAHIQINSQGVIGQEWSRNRAEEYRILTVGGSTTECLYLDQTKTWPALLQAGLDRTADGRKVWVGNLGKAGLNTRDHLALMRLAIDQYPVDAIVMLIGGNDMVHRLMQDESYDPYFIEDSARYQAWLSKRFAIAPRALYSSERSFFKRTALWQFGKRIKQLSKAMSKDKTIPQDKAGAWLVQFRKARQEASLVDELPPLESGLDEYERNIRRIIDEAQYRSIRIVFLTQPTIWEPIMPDQERNLLWMGYRPDGRFYTTDALRRAMDSYNRRLLEVCAKVDVESVDIAARLPHTLDVFYDDMHFNESGAQRLADELVHYLKARSPFL